MPRLTYVEKVVRRKPDKSEQDEKKNKPDFAAMLEQALDSDKKFENPGKNSLTPQNHDKHSLDSQKESLQALKSLLKAPEEL